MNVCESLTGTAKLWPERTALRSGNLAFTYADLEESSRRAALRLIHFGIRPGDRVALQLANTGAFPIWYYGALRMGAVAVSISTRLAAAEVAYMTKDCGAALLVASAANQDVRPASAHCPRWFVDDESGVLFDASEGEAIAPDPRSLEADSRRMCHAAHPEDPALILYTSGTTGFPKGATLSHANVRSNVHAFNHLCGMSRDDRVLCAVPLFHCFGQNALLNSVLNAGGTLVLQQRFDLNETKRLIAEHQITQFYGVPMMFDMLLQSCSPEDLATVTYCFSAAAPLPLATSHAWNAKFGQPIYEGYGLTETSPFATYNHRSKFVPGSIGTPVDNVEVKIVCLETGEECPAGEVGEIAIRGPNVMLGYWNRPEDTANAIREGWFHSGDLGRQDQDGYVYIVDRIKDMLVVGGLKIFPAEVERVIGAHPHVREIAVVGRADPVLGEQPVGFVVLHETAEASSAVTEIVAFARERLGQYKVPRLLWRVAELPRNAAGKILKTTLREWAEMRVAQGDHGTPLTDGDVASSAGELSSADTGDVDARGNGVTPTLPAALAQTHASEKIRVVTAFLREQVMSLGDSTALPDATMTFVEAGLDSLALVALSTRLQVEVGQRCELPPTLLFDYPRIADLAPFLVQVLEARRPTPAVEGPSSHETTYGPAVNFGPEKEAAARELPSRDCRGPMRCEVGPAEVARMSEDEALAALMKELE